MGGPGSGGKPRKYPTEIIDLACGMYQSGMTVAEICAAFPAGYRVQTILQRHLPARRPSIPRDQTGERNPAWKGDEAGYCGVHWRLATTRGKASSRRCVGCDRRADDWSYLGGCPQEQTSPVNGCAYSPDPDRYVPRCRSCHTAADRQRLSNGRFAPRGGDANVC